MKKCYLSFLTGPLRVARSLRDMCTLLWEVRTLWSSRWSEYLGWLLEELFYVGDVLREAVGWEGFKEDAAVALALDAGV